MRIRARGQTIGLIGVYQRQQRKIMGNTDNKELVELVLRESPPVAGAAALGANMTKYVATGFKSLNDNGTCQWGLPSIRTVLRKCDLRNARSFSVLCLSDRLLPLGRPPIFILHLYGFVQYLETT